MPLLLCYVFFILSCLSKAMAVVLPFVLVLIDIYQRRKFSWKMIAEKVLLFAFALWIGIITVKMQSEVAIADFQLFTIWQRICFASYSFLMYWVKLILPLGLSAFYKYPGFNEQGSLPLIYQLSPAVVIVLIFALFFLLYKMKKEKFNTTFFGMGFFVITVALVLQFISVGAALMADRYTYLPYIGAFFLIFSFVDPDIRKPKIRKLLLGISFAAALVFGALSYQHVKVWDNSGTLWSDVIEQYPYVITQTGNIVSVEQTGVDVAYKNRGNYYRENNQMDKAFDDYNTLILANSKDIGAYSNMGNFYGLKAQEAAKKGNMKEAEKLYSKSIEIYNKGLKIKQDDYDIRYNIGITYSLLGKSNEAITNFLMALKINPAAENIYDNLALEYLHIADYAESIKYCNNIISKKTNDANIFFYRGTDYFNLGKYNDAISDLLKATSIEPSNANAWYNLSIAQNKISQFKEALNSAKKAKENAYNVSAGYLHDLELKAR